MKLRRPEVGGDFGPKQAQVGGVRLIARCGQNREREERSLMAGPCSAEPPAGWQHNQFSEFVRRERGRDSQAESDCKNHLCRRRRRRVRRRRLVWVAVHNHGSFTFGEKRERRREREAERRGRAKYETPLLSRHAAPLLERRLEEKGLQLATTLLPYSIHTSC